MRRTSAPNTQRGGWFLPFLSDALLLSLLLAGTALCCQSLYGLVSDTRLLLLTAAAHLPLATANGTAKVLNLTTNLTGLALFWLHGQVLLPLGLAAGACGLVGNWLGTAFFLDKGAKGVKPIMLGVLGIFFLKILLE